MFHSLFASLTMMLLALIFLLACSVAANVLECGVVSIWNTEGFADCEAASFAWRQRARLSRQNFREENRPQVMPSSSNNSTSTFIIFYRNFYFVLRHLQNCCPLFDLSLQHSLNHRIFPVFPPSLTLSLCTHPSSPLCSCNTIAGSPCPRVVEWHRRLAVQWQRSHPRSWYIPCGL